MGEVYFFMIEHQAEHVPYTPYTVSSGSVCSEVHTLMGGITLSTVTLGISYYTMQFSLPSIHGFVRYFRIFIKLGCEIKSVAHPTVLCNTIYVQNIL